MKFKLLAATALLAFAVSGCAGSATKPVVVTALANQQAKIAITDVTAVAAPGVDMGNDDIVRMVNGIKGKLTAANLDASANPDSQPMTLRITFTAYDPGNAGARALMMGLGQIHIDGDIAFVDGAGNMVGKYQISKQFAIGGLIGAATTIKDVEVGFESSVADMVKDPSSQGKSDNQTKPKQKLRPL